MKKLILLSIAAIVLTSYGANPPLGKTAAPEEGFCAECHRPSSNPFNGSIDITGIPKQIEPFTTYPITITLLNPNVTIARGGFEMTILEANNNTAAGNLTNRGENTTIRSRSGRQYLSHGPAQSFNDSTSISYSADWESGDLSEVDSIKIYAAAILANGNGRNTGDTPIAYHSESIIPSSSTPIFDEKLENSIQFYQDKILLKEDFKGLKYSIFNINGNIISKGNVYGEIDISYFNSGMYIIIVNNHTFKFMK